MSHQSHFCLHHSSPSLALQSVFLLVSFLSLPHPCTTARHTNSLRLTNYSTMGIKTIYKKKDPTEAELVEDLNKIGVSTKSNKGRQEKFGAFREYAQERQARKPGLAPQNPYANVSSGGPGPGGNPYVGNGSAGSSAGPYGGQNGNHGNNSSPYGTQNGGSGASGSPYGAGASASGYGAGASNSPYDRAGASSPYGNSGASSPYGSASNGAGRSGNSSGPSKSPYAQATNANGQNSNARNGPYARATQVAGSAASPYKTKSVASDRDADTESLDLNAIPLNQLYMRRPPKQTPDDATLDLNALPEEDDLNVEDELPEEEQVNSEDEEVEGIKQDIRFVKQESLALTRNTLRMAQEADASATNTMGMLGSQSERLYNAEQNLLLADTQTNIAHDKVNELKRLNRSIFIPAQGNPFNRKSRLRQQEEKIKAQKTQEKYLRETNRQGAYASEQRLKQGITLNATNSEIHRKYKDDQSLAAAKRYQFENDSEDDEMEKELAANLDQIGLYLKKLKNAASTMGVEVESQNNRLRDIEENADRLDINVHMNSARLNNIR